MKKKLQEKMREALNAVLPITIIVFLLSVLVTPVHTGTLGLFLFGAMLLTIGMGLFTLGIDMAMIPMGEGISTQLTKVKKIALIGLFSFIIGVIVTIAEPNLQVLAKLVPDIDNMTLILTVACGVGIMLAVAIFRILFQISLGKTFIFFFSAVFIISFFMPESFVSVAFDSGGLSTGSITVPFILALGLGIAAVRGDKDSVDDSFGLLALCSLGPIMTVLILGLFFNPSGTDYDVGVIPDIVTTRDVTLEFLYQLPGYVKEVVLSVSPIILVLFVFQLVSRRFKKQQMLRMLIGFAYTFAGLVLFLTGVNVGFIPVGQSFGADLANSSIPWLLVPLGALIGYFIVAAEPTVHVLKKQVEEVSSGAIPGNALQTCLSIGVAVSLAISMLRVLTGISIYWFLIPGYAIALILTFFVPKIFTGIAFDSGCVVSGPMTATFSLPFAIGACVDTSRIMTDAFGLVAMVAMAPVIVIQVMGLLYKSKMEQAQESDLVEDNDDEIIEFEEELSVDDNGEQEPSVSDNDDEIINFEEEPSK